MLAVVQRALDTEMILSKQAEAKNPKHCIYARKISNFNGLICSSN